MMLYLLHTKRAEDVAVHVLRAFAFIGAPAILQSDDGCEFASEVVKELRDLWDIIRIVHGKIRHSQSQGCVKRADEYVKKMFASWMVHRK